MSLILISAPPPSAMPHLPASLGQARAIGIAGILGLGLLLALVAGWVIGIGIFGLLQNGVARWCAGAILTGWTATGVGTLLLAGVYRMPPLLISEPGQGLHV